MQMALRTLSGRSIVPADVLGKGGEGKVYAVSAVPDLAIKIYDKKLAGTRKDKILAMCSAGFNAMNSVAFPVEPVFDGTKAFAGFTMPRAGGQKAIHSLYSPASRKQEFPKASFPFLIRVSLNIARTVYNLHSRNCVIGDINHSGILVSPEATVTLIDADSFQFTHEGNVFPCLVGVPEFTPPELQGQRLDRITRTFNHDNFGLAVLIFNLLFMGKHPFAGRYLGPGEPPGLCEAITRCRFAYSKENSITLMEPPPNSPSLGDIPCDLAEAFEQAFTLRGSKQGRPSAEKWTELLERAETSLVQCSQVTSHQYFREAPFCPWCKMERACPGFSAFSPVLSSGSTHDGSVNLSLLLQRLNALPDPGPVSDPLMPSGTSTAILAPSSIKTKSEFISRCTLTSFGILSGFAWLLYASSANILGLLLLVVSARYGWQALTFAQKLRTDSQAARTRWLAALNNWKHLAGNGAFGEAKAEALSLARESQQLPNAEQRRLNQLHQQRRDHQLRAFLERLRIDSARIKNIGPARKVTLRSYGIETAADISDVMLARVHGFGPTIISSLLRWRASVEARFVFNSNLPVDAAEIQRVKAEIVRERARLVAQLSAVVAKTEKVRADALVFRSNAAQALSVPWSTYKEAEALAESLSTVRNVQLATVILLLVAMTIIRADTGVRTVSASSTAPISAPSVPLSQVSKAVLPGANESKSSAGQSIPDQRRTTEGGVPNTSVSIPPLPVSSGNIAPKLPEPIEVKSRPEASASFSMEQGGSEPSRFAAIEPVQPAVQQSRLPPPPGAMRNPLNKDDAKWIHERLRTLGFRTADADEEWSSASRQSLKDFRAANKLSTKEEWDARTEELLGKTTAIRADQSFLGTWAPTKQECGDQAININSNRASNESGTCLFDSVEPNGASWRAVSLCAVDGENWRANIKLAVDKKGHLIWTSEKGTTTYIRCPR